ncbi:MAG: SDR family NAD(P)-dependent oxidoreductase, partial [Actinomycetes bacterium]
MEKKVALVTGAASGIGAAIATRFQQNGWLVASIDKNKANSDISIQANVANLTEIKEAVKEIENKLGPIDSAVSNAGHYEMKS